MAKPARSHKQKLEEQAALAFDAMAEQEWRQLLSITEERNLAFCLPKLAAMAAQMGVGDIPVCDWSKDQMLQFLAMAIRCANPFLTPPNLEAYREFNDTIPF